VTDSFALEALTPWLHYRVDGGSWQEVLMTALGGDEYAADIPGLPIGSLVEYYLEADDTQGLAARLPLLAPAELFSFTVWQDTQPPDVVHTPLGDQPLGSWPPAVAAVVTDNLGLSGVALSFTVNGGPASGPHPLLRGVGDLYALPFPLSAGELTAGDLVAYTIAATDASAGANVTEDGPHSFTVVAGSGQILVIDDESGGEAATVAAWLGDAGYATTVRAAAVLTAGDLTGKQAVVLLSGSNADPLTPLTVRQNVRSWVNGGGRLLVEGGETGFAALVVPGYAAFAAEVLHASAWLGDDSGSLIAAPGQAGHDLLTRPDAVTPPLTLAYTAESDQDAMVPLANAFLVLENADRPSTAGVLVHDDNPIDPAAQVVYLPFALSALTDQDQARGLVLNALAHLLDTRMPSAVGDDPAGPPRLARLLGVAPNPFNAHTHVRIETTAEGPVQLDVYDVRGRLVRRLLDCVRSLPAGPHDIAWDGRDEHGRDAASGIYFVHLAAGGLVERGKLALVR
jgi:hypothetical protein